MIINYDEKMTVGPCCFDEILLMVNKEIYIMYLFKKEVICQMIQYHRICRVNCIGFREQFNTFLNRFMLERNNKDIGNVF